MLLPKGTNLFQKLFGGCWPACSYDNFVPQTIEMSVLFILLPHSMYLEHLSGGWFAGGGSHFAMVCVVSGLLSKGLFMSR